MKNTALLTTFLTLIGILLSSSSGPFASFTDLAPPQDSFVSESRSSLRNDNAQSLKILSWNIYMLPPLAKHTGKRRRAVNIGKLLRDSEYDVLVLQESFHPAARKRIETHLQNDYPHRIGPANQKFSIKTNSGIWILSRYPMRELGTIAYSECSGSDCMARKGALMVELDFKGRPIQILGTHLQAGGSDEIRRSQYREMSVLIKAHEKEGIPQLICGDMNTRRSDATNYPYMLETLDVEDGPFIGDRQFTTDGVANDMCGGGSRNRKVIDYIFHRSQGRTFRRLHRWIPDLEMRWSARHRDLSDHNPVAVDVVWE